MDRFADNVVAAERKREVADAATDLDAGTRGLDDLRGLDVVHRVVVVLLQAGRNRQDIRIEDDVGRVETRLLDQELVGALTDLDLPGDRIGLPGLVERHDDDTRAIAMYGSRLLEEVRFPFLQADRVDHALSLDALQARLEYGPLRAVDNDGNPGDLRLRRDVIEKRRHRLL